MPRELKDLGTTVSLRPARRGRRLLLLLAAVLVLGAVAARAGDEADEPLAGIDAVEQPEVLAETLEVPAVTEEAGPTLPVLGRVGDLVVHVPAEDPILVSYHEAAFPEALPLTALGSLSVNENATRPLSAEPHPDGLSFHVQVSRGRSNASTSAVDIVMAPDEAVRSPIAGTVIEVRPYQLYGAHDDVRLELRADDGDLAVVLIHIEDVVVRAGDRVEVGDVVAGAARAFPFGAVVDKQTEPERYGHVHLEVKAPA